MSRISCISRCRPEAEPNSYAAFSDMVSFIGFSLGRSNTQGKLRAIHIGCARGAQFTGDRQSHRAPQPKARNRALVGFRLLRNRETTCARDCQLVTRQAASIELQVCLRVKTLEALNVLFPKVRSARILAVKREHVLKDSRAVRVDGMYGAPSAGVARPLHRLIE